MHTANIREENTEIIILIDVNNRYTIYGRNNEFRGNLMCFLHMILEWHTANDEYGRGYMYG